MSITIHFLATIGVAVILALLKFVGYKASGYTIDDVMNGPKTGLIGLVRAGFVYYLIWEWIGLLGIIG